MKRDRYRKKKMAERLIVREGEGADRERETERKRERKKPVTYYISLSILYKDNIALYLYFHPAYTYISILH